jgi:Tol biopolymer transport system component
VIGPTIPRRTTPSRVQISRTRRETAGHTGGTSDFVSGRRPQLVINPDSKSGYTDVNPTWSPDSQWIAFSRDHRADPFVDIYKVRRDGSQVAPVTELNELAENRVWGSDGRIIFMHDQGIAVVGSDGGEIEHLTATRTGLPYWWPDW